MIRWSILFTFFLGSLTAVWAQQNGYKVGVTAAPGIPYPSENADAIALEKSIIYFRGFEDMWIDEYNKVPLSSFQYLYQFNNTSGSPVYTPIEIPIYFFFSEFDKVNRSNILNNLAELMPDILNLEQDEVQIKEDLRAQFANRNFIRRIINKRNLDKLNMNIRVWQNDQEIKVGKVVLEFRWIKDRERNQEVLAMDAFIHVDLQFKQPGLSTVRINHAVPAYYQQAQKDRYYTPFHLGTGSNWKGPLGQVYLVRNALDAAMAFPYYFSGDTYSYDTDKQVMVLQNHEPEKSEKVAFYTYRGTNCGCYAGDALPEKLFFPTALSQVTASNWWNPQHSVAKQCVEASAQRTTVKWVPDWEHGLGGKLTIDAAPLDQVLDTREKLDPLFSNDCDVAGEPVLTYQEGYHPYLAFDVAQDSVEVGGMQVEGHFGVKSGWCVQSDRQGRGESLTFTTKQPVDEIKFYTGLHADDASYKRYNRVKQFDMEQINGPFRKTLTFSDIVTSSYEVDLPPGTYKMTISDLYEGERPDITCFSAIQLHFHFGDNWFNTFFEQL